MMNRERRRDALAKFVGIVTTDIERERKRKAGVENLAKAIQYPKQYASLKYIIKLPCRQCYPL